jgi:hypothetical protein
MPIQTDSLNKKLYDLLKTQGLKPVAKDSENETTPVPDEAEVIQFQLDTGDGTPEVLWATVDSSRKLTLYYDDDVMEDAEDSKKWDALRNHLKNWAMRKQLGFQLKNKDHLASDMAQRDYMNKKEKISEGYYPMGKTASYSDAVPTVKIVLQHNRSIQEGEQRYRNIAKIFLENQEGERFLAPTTKPGIARVYARHIAEGGQPHDDRWNHIGSLCEEYQKMAGFVRATRSSQFNESAQRLVNEGINHYQSLRESLSKMAGHRGYNNYFESWTPPLMEDDSDTSNINELFVQETVDPRIESVMPILSKLHKNIAEMKEVSELAEWADSLTEIALEEGEIYSSPTNEAVIPDPKYDHEPPAQESDPIPDDSDHDPIPDDQEPELDESSDDIDDPVVSAITRRIIRQHPELLKHGPDKVLAAIADVADFVGDVEEIGSSDVSGWVRQVAQSLGSKLEEALDPEKKQRLDDLISRYEDATDPEDMGDERHEDIIAQIRTEFGDKTADSVANGPSMHFPRPGHSMGHDDLEFRQMRKNSSPNRITKLGKLHKQDNDTMKRDIKDKLGVEEGFADAIKKGVKALDRIVTGGDKEDLLKKLQKDAGVPSHAQHGKPNMAKPKDEEVDEGDVTHTPKGLIHKSTDRYGGGEEHTQGERKVAMDLDSLNKQQVKDFDDSIGVRWKKEGPKGIKVDEDSEFAGDYATGEAGQWRNKGPKANKPATIGDLVGESIAEGQEDLDTIRRLLGK